jgi:hypothetical protein
MVVASLAKTSLAPPTRGSLAALNTPSSFAATVFPFSSLQPAASAAMRTRAKARREVVVRDRVAPRMDQLQRKWSF